MISDVTIKNNIPKLKAYLRKKNGKDNQSNKKGIRRDSGQAQVH